MADKSELKDEAELKPEHGVTLDKPKPEVKPEPVSEPIEDDKSDTIRAISQKQGGSAVTKDDFAAAIEAPMDAFPMLTAKKPISRAVCEAVINGFPDGVRDQWGELNVGFDVEASEDPIISRVPIYTVAMRSAISEVTVEVTVHANDARMRLHKEAALDGVLAPLVKGIPFDSAGNAVLSLAAVRNVRYTFDSEFKINVEMQFVLKPSSSLGSRSR